MLTVIPGLFDSGIIMNRWNSLADRATGWEARILFSIGQEMILEKFQNPSNSECHTLLSEPFPEPQ
jgi:hypothetical protein